jgi:HD-GYP domain-containing protein (c-di-GMP phosphodiesterase class II)
MPFNHHTGASVSDIAAESRTLMSEMDLPSPDYGSPDGHSERVAIYSVAIGRRLDLPEPTVFALRSAAILHDIGKVGISPSIVNKLGRLTDHEFEIMRLHSVIAARMLERAEGLKESVVMIKHHHERFDGRGYPDGLKGVETPIGARIIAVAETFDTLVSGAPWRDAVSVEEAICELRRNAGTQFDPAIVDAFIEVLLAMDHPDDGAVLSDDIDNCTQPTVH